MRRSLVSLEYETLPGDIDHLIADDHAIVERQFHRNTSTTAAARIEPTIRCSSKLEIDARMSAEIRDLLKAK